MNAVVSESRDTSTGVHGCGLRVLWIAKSCPYPPTDGEKLRMFHLLDELARRGHEITLVCRTMSEDQRGDASPLERICRGGVHRVDIPSPTGHLERLRWMAPFVFSAYPVDVCTVYFEPFRAVLERLARERQFDVVQVEHSSLTIYLDRVDFPGRPARVLTMHNIDYLRNERVLAHTPFGAKWLYQRFNQRRQKPWELAALARYDVVIAMSELERRTMLTECPGLPAHVVPNGVDCSGLPFQLGPADSQGLLFVASMDSSANHDGAMFFLRDVMPRILRKHPDASVALVGRGPRPELLAQADGRHVVVTGQVDSVLPYYRRAAVAVVPLRSGGGTRLKILEAFAAGTPVVSTRVGAEGLDVVDGRHLLLADSPEEFAAAVGRLLIDPGMRAELAQRGRHLVEQRYDWPMLGGIHDAIYREAVRHARH